MAEDASASASMIAEPLSSEDELVQQIMYDMPFVLQGIGTALLPFKSNMIVLPSDLPLPMASLVEKLCEPAILYRKINTLMANESRTMVVQALHKCIRTQLENYLLLIAELESRTRSSKATLTMTACQSLLSQPVLALRFIYGLLRECAYSKLVGGQVLSLLYEYTWHGDPFIQDMSKELFDATYEPFERILNTWVSSGKLDDPFEEFFVTIQTPDSAWTNRFYLDASKVPKSISISEAKRVFEIGKTQYCLRVLCYEDEYVQNTSGASDSGEDVIRHLNSLLVEKYHLHQHLTALKKYMLLSQGDFADSLVKLGYEHLRVAAKGLLRNRLSWVLESAIEVSNTQFEDTEVLSRLDCAIIDKGSNLEAWEVFALEYRFGSPLDVIIDQETYLIYSKLFDHLWAIRWVINRLELSWRNLLVVQQQLGSGIDLDWSRYEEPRHFIAMFFNGLLNFAYTSVLEPEWRKFEQEIPPLHAGSVTIDDIYSAHHRFISTVYSLIMLGGDITTVLKVKQLIKLGLRFSSHLDDLCSAADDASLSDNEQEHIKLLSASIEEATQKFSDLIRELFSAIRKSDNDRLRVVASGFPSYWTD